MAPPLSRVIVNLYYTSEETKVSLVKHTISVVNMFSSRKGTNTVDFPYFLVSKPDWLNTFQISIFIFKVGRQVFSWISLSWWRDYISQICLFQVCECFCVRLLWMLRTKLKDPAVHMCMHAPHGSLVNFRCLCVRMESAFWFFSKEPKISCIQQWT